MFEQITHIDEEKKRNRHFNEKKRRIDELSSNDTKVKVY